jgi:hypothetical protein
LRAFLAVVLFTSIGFGQTPTATPEKRAEARARYENGLRKFDVAKFDEAASEFVAAYEIVGDPSILYNIAQSYRLGERHEKALLFYKAYQRHLPPKSPVRAEVEKRITELGEVLKESKRATSAPPTGTIKSEHLGSESTRPVRPETSRPLETTRPPETRPPETRPPETRPPETKPPEAKPPETRPPEVAQVPKKPPEEKKPGGPPSPALKYAGIALLGVAVAGIAVGAGMSGAAAHNSQNLEDAAKQRVAFGPHLQNSESNGQLYDTLSYVFYGIGGAAAVAGAVTLYFGLRKPASSRAQLTPLIGPNGAGVSLAGRF